MSELPDPRKQTNDELLARARQAVAEYNTSVSAHSPSEELRLVLALADRLEAAVATMTQARDMMWTIHAHRFDADRRSDPAHAQWLATFGEAPVRRPDLFYAGVEFAVNRLRPILAEEKPQRWADEYLHACGAAGILVCGKPMRGGYTGLPRRSTTLDSAVTCPDCQAQLGGANGGDRS